jgi:hypothetical protein
MKYLILILAALQTVVYASSPATFYKIGGDYVDSMAPFKGAVWANSGDELKTYEYKVRFLLQTDKRLKDQIAVLKSLIASERSTTEKNLLQGLITHQYSLQAAADDLNRVLASEFQAAKAYFDKAPNPSLLMMMHCHYHIYIQTPNQNWREIFAVLKAIDPTITGLAEEKASQYNIK